MKNSGTRKIAGGPGGVHIYLRWPTVLWRVGSDFAELWFFNKWKMEAQKHLPVISSHSTTRVDRNKTALREIALHEQRRLLQQFLQEEAGTQGCVLCPCWHVSLLLSGRLCPRLPRGTRQQAFFLFYASSGARTAADTSFVCLHTLHI